MVPAHWFQGLQKGAPQALILYMGAEKHFFTLRCDQQTKVLAIKMRKSNQVNDSFRLGGLYKRFPKSDHTRFCELTDAQMPHTAKVPSIFACSCLASTPILLSLNKTSLI